MSRAVLSVLCLLSFVSPAWAAPEPDAVVGNFHAALTDAMEHGEALACKGRIDKLQPTVVTTFDIPFLASHILRRRWETMSAQQRTDFTATLQELIVVTYASNFSHNSGVKFATVETRDLAGGRRQVRARLTPAHDEPVTLDYFLQQKDGAWRVINVIANGVSDLALRSSQYDKIFAQSGFDGLMAKLRKQIASDRAAC